MEKDREKRRKGGETERGVGKEEGRGKRQERGRRGGGGRGRNEESAKTGGNVTVSISICFSLAEDLAFNGRKAQ